MAASVPEHVPVILGLQIPPLYRPLHTQDGQIRLLTILSEAYSHDIHCHLETVSLKDLAPAYRRFLDENDLSGHRAPTALGKWTEHHLSPTMAKLDPLKRVVLTQPSAQLHRFTWGDFAALSYVWGDPNEKAFIVVNSRVVCVSANLERLLREFRSTGDFQGRFRLWVDALCINQDDLKERASLIQSMPAMYRSAWSVVAWLGEASPRSGLALQLVRDLVTFREASCEFELEKRLREDPGFLGSLSWLGLHEFMDRPYWYRLWIIQEIVMGGARATIRCGNSSIDWPTFCSGIAVLQESLWVVKDRCLWGDIEAATSLQATAWKTTSLHLVYKHLSRLGSNKSRTGDLDLGLGRLLQLASDSKCLDPRDKVYALTGFMPTSVAGLLQPDYTLPVSQVYMNATKAFIQGLDSLESLREVNPWGPTDCPSWTADWRWRGNPMMQRRIEGPFWGPAYLFPRNSDDLDYLPYTASRDARNSASFFGDGLLECRGFVIGAISGISARGRGFFSWEEHTIVSSDDFCSAYGSREATTAAVFRTLIMDRDIYGQKATERHAAILQLPSAFDNAAVEFVKRGWSWLADLRLYYFRWEVFRKSNTTFRIGDTNFDDFFGDEIPADASERDFTEAYSCFDRSSQKRRFMTTSTGHVGWAPDNIYGRASEQTQVGDLVAIIFGCSMPLTIRALPDGKHYHILGEAYVQGMMDGEAMDDLQTGKYEARTFTFC